MANRKKHYRMQKLANPRFIILSSVVLLVLILVAISLNVKMELVVQGGTEPLQLVYGQEVYNEPGAVATANGEPIDVTISGEVDTNKLGTYQITYRARYLWLSKTVRREVRVVDITAPVLTLNKTPGYLVPSGEEYQEEGYMAIDDYDGDITSRVQVQRQGDKITYTVTDSSGNYAIKVRYIPRADLEAPVLTLLGAENMTIKAGTAFTDPGFTAMDNIDGDIASQVTVTGSVDIYLADTYVLTYSVTDNAGNTATAKRTVVVEALKQPDTISPDGKVIYLTFDDGPSAYTQNLLDVLNKYNAKATFFVVKTGYHKTHQILNNIVKGGHSIGVHSASHVYSEIYASEAAFFQDLRTMQQFIKDHTGVETYLMRFPGGGSNTISKKYCVGIMTKLTKAVQDQGFRYFDWNVDSKDAGGAKTADEIYQNVISGIGNRKTAVVLQHDIHKCSVEAVEKILIWGIENGYRFEALNMNSPICHQTVHN